MEIPSPPPSLCTQTLVQNSKEAMEKFQELIFTLAQTHPNKPLTPLTKTLLHSRFNQFVSEHKTPDHLPYSAMIHMAVEELNRKRGCSEKAIREYLEKTYDKLPWAHSGLLSHHLQKLCESGELVVTRDKRYVLPRNMNSRKMKSNKDIDGENGIMHSEDKLDQPKRRSERLKVIQNGGCCKDKLERSKQDDQVSDEEEPVHSEDKLENRACCQVKFDQSKQQATPSEDKLDPPKQHSQDMLDQPKPRRGRPPKHNVNYILIN